MKKIFYIKFAALTLAAVTALFLSVPASHASDNPLAPLTQRLKRIASQYPDIQTGCCVIDIETGAKAQINSSSMFPLASVFKVPVMIELCRCLQKGDKNITLNMPLTIRPEDKCIGSGALQHKPDNSIVALSKAVELMEIESDNTATDMIFSLIGTESVNPMLRSFGMKNCDIYLKNRPAWLITLGQGQFQGMNGREIAAAWKQMTPKERCDAALNTEKSCRTLTLKQFQALEDASYKYSTPADNIASAETVDNMGSPDDFALMFSLLWQRRLLNDRWTKYCLGILERQKYNSRIPAKLPKGAKVCHKTGTLTGIINDAGIMFPDGHPVAIAVFLKRVPDGREKDANELIARMARASWDTISRLHNKER